MTDRVPVRVAPGVSPLTLGVLRAALYPDDEARRAVVQLLGGWTLRDADAVLPRLYRVDPAGPLLTDCPEYRGRPASPSLPGELRVCPCDIRHQATLHRSAPAAGSPAEEVFPAFPHRWPWNDVEPPTVGEVPEGRPVIGFCGVARPGTRRDALRALGRLADAGHIGIDVVERVEFFGGEKPWREARTEYLANMARTSYQLCAPGVGRFCYRAFEAMSLGRIPIAVDLPLPLAGVLPWSELAVVAQSPGDLREALPVWHDRRASRLREVSREVRQTWRQNLSAVGWWSGAVARGIVAQATP